ncbi:MAG: M20 family metallopeptidase, partial [Chloroflexota bacterium]
ELQALGMEVQTGVGKTGVVGILEGDTDGPTILVRADMDALPIAEANQVDYLSTVDGKMHACGHDGHTAIALGVAKLFANNRDQLAGRIKFVFQPAEEIGAGAKAMVDDGVLNDPRPDVSLGLHLWNPLPVGKINVQSGPVMAGISRFEINIQGMGGHGAMPHETADPIVCASQMVLALQTIVSRNANPLESAVLSVAQVHAGTADNIIPDTARITGTFRTYTLEMRDLVCERMATIAEHTALASGCTASLDITHPGMAVNNHDDVVEKAKETWRNLGREDDFTLTRTTASEDVGWFMDDIPGMYFLLGSGNAERDLAYPHHHPRFDFDEDVLPIGVELLSAAVASYLIQE